MEFYDQNNLTDRRIDIGIEFIESLELKDFVFTSLGWAGGSETFETLGLPSLDMNLGSISGFKETESQIWNEKLADNSQFIYTAVTYKFGDLSGNTLVQGKNKTTNENVPSKEEVEKANDTGSKPEEGKGSGLTTATTVKYNVGFKYGFEMQLTARKDNEGNQMYCFEYMMLTIGVSGNVKTSYRIALLLGLSILIELDVLGSITGVYNIKTTYKNDETWANKYVVYDPATFSMFSSNEKLARSFIIYLMVEFELNIGVGFLFADVLINNSFKFDFVFGFFDEDNINASEGKMTYTLSYSIAVLTVTVYEKDLKTSLMNSIQPVFNTSM